ncbi:MAG: DUF5702 domain-containing protein [Lachnospiraceae bacterium]|nr:DUF5702 domain-containing protein [Lachnospiraceae bacterium]
MRGEKGSITVFFSLIFTLIIALLCTVAESSKVYVSYARAKSMSYMAAESELAGYARELYDEYGVLAVWDKNISQSLRSFVELNNTDRSIVLEDVNIVGDNSVTKGGADDFIKQITDYEKYEVVEKGAEYIIECLNRYKESEGKAVDKRDDISKLFSEENSKRIDELSKFAKKTDKHIRRIINKKGDGLKISGRIEKMFEQEKDGFTNDGINQLKQEKEKMSKYIGTMNNIVSDIEKAGNNYEKKRQQVYEGFDEEIRKNVSDNWDSNSIVIKKIKDNLRLFEENEMAEFNNYVNSVEEGDKPDIEEIRKKIVGPLNSRLADTDTLIDSLIVNEDSIDENQKKNLKELYDTSKKLVQDGVLGLVIENADELSKNAISTDGLPSKETDSHSKIYTLDNLINKGLFVSYINNNFNCYTKSDGKDDTALLYEMEYIINGKDSDKNNMSATVTKLVAIRQVINNICILSDSSKISECEEAAMLISIVIGLPELEPAIKVLLIEAWALSESVWEVRELLKGNSLELIKSAKDWRTSLWGMGKSFSKECESLAGADSGDENNFEVKLNYEIYLDILLMIEGKIKLAYRTMDLMQANMAKKYNSDFRLADCVNCIDVRCDYSFNNVFLKLPVVQSVTGTKEEGYKKTINIKYSYIER